MKRLIAILTLNVMVLGLVAPACSDSDGEAVDAGELQPIIDSWAEGHGVSDLAVSVRSPSGSFTSGGFSTGDEAPDDSSLLMVGSLTKTMTAAAALLLVEDGTLDLDEPIQQWLPDFPRADEMTLRLLLSHTAGMANPSGGGETGPAALVALLEPTTVTELLADAADSVRDVQLPAAYQYSNPGYSVVGAVIEAATGQPIADVLRAEIVEPLGMEDTYLAWSEPVDEPVVPGKLELPDGMQVPLGSEFVPGLASGGWTSGGVLSSAHDMAVFYGALFDELLAPDSLEALKTGLGIDGSRRWPDGSTGWFKRGAIDGYVAGAGVSEAGWTVAVLTNRFNVEEIAASDYTNEPLHLVGELLAHLHTAG